MNSLLSNSFFNFFSQILTFTSGTILAVIWARYLGPIAMGELSFFIWLATTIAFISTLGLSNTLARYIPTFIAGGKINQVKHLISKIFLFELKISLIVTLIFLLIIGFLNISNKGLYYVIAITIPVLILNNTINGFTQGLQKYDLLFKINLFVVILNLTASLTLLFLGKYLLELMILYFIISIVFLIISIYYLKEYITLKSPNIPNGLYKEILKYTGSVFFIILLDSILMEKSEIFFLKLFSPIEQVAFYSLGFNFVSKIMILIPGAITGVLMPRIASYSDKKDELAIRTTYWNISRYLILVTLPIIFAGFVLSDLLIHILLGKDYLSVIPVIKILLISGGLSAIVGATSSLLYGIGRQNIILKLALIAVSINIFLDLYLIPRFGAIGAALANATAQILTAFVGTYYIVYIQKMPFPLLPCMKIALSALFGSVFIFILGKIIILPDVIQLIFLSFIFISLFTTSLLVMKFFNAKDVEIIKRLKFQ